jgi:hypothetical protein
MDILRSERSERGSVFITTMISVFLMSLVSGYAYQLGARDMHFVHRMETGAQAQQLAEAGLTRMLRALETDWEASVGDTLSDEIGNGNYSVSVDNVGGRYLIESTGIADGVSRLITAEVTGGTIPGGGALDYAIAGGGDLDIDSGTADSPGTITGSIYAGGDIDLDGPSNGGALTVSGEVDAQDDIDSSPSVSVGGSVVENYANDPEFAAPDMDHFKSIAQANGYYYTTNKTYTAASPLPSPPGGVLYTTGDVVIQGTQSATVCIVAGGNITINKSGSTYPRVTIVAPEDMPATVSAGNTTFVSTGNGQAYFRVTGLIYSGGNFDFSTGNQGEFTVNGSIQALGNVAVSPTAQSTVTVNYVAQGDLDGMDGDADIEQEFSVVSFNS